MTSIAGDVATIEPSVKPVYTIVTANGKPAVLININRQPSGNTVAVADEVAAEVENIKQTLPLGDTTVAAGLPDDAPALVCGADGVICPQRGATTVRDAVRAHAERARAWREEGTAPARVASDIGRRDAP